MFATLVLLMIEMFQEDKKVNLTETIRYEFLDESYVV
jgi:hypothetical protein